MGTNLVSGTKDNSFIAWLSQGGDAEPGVADIVAAYMVLFVAQEGDHSLLCPKGSFWPCFPCYGDGEQMEGVQWW